MKNRIFHIHALTATHAGTGQGIGLIDLPIARERSTYLPIIPGSGLKGVLREELRPDGEDKAIWQTLFGPENNHAEENPFAGALTVGDALLLCFPVRSVKGTFAWVTSPWILHRYRRDWQLLGESMSIPSVETNRIKVTPQSKLTHEGHVCLEDLDLSVASDDDPDIKDLSDRIAREVFPDDPEWSTLFKERFALVDDETFDFLIENATEVRARIRIDEKTRTVAKGALWYEENLPAESILWGLMACSRSRKPEQAISSGKELLRIFEQQLFADGECRLQLGGKATVGRGQARFILNGGQSNAANPQSK
ncbi:MAG: type III-B CRISPR module RAMP protein Cmr4 [Methylohalobius crimeensis]